MYGAARNAKSYSSLKLACVISCWTFLMATTWPYVNFFPVHCSFLVCIFYISVFWETSFCLALFSLSFFPLSSFPFADRNTYIKDIHVKLSILEELTGFVCSKPEALTGSIQNAIVLCFSANCLRSLPAYPEALADADEEDIVQESSWPHLEVWGWNMQTTHRIICICSDDQGNGEEKSGARWSTSLSCALSLSLSLSLHPFPLSIYIGKVCYALFRELLEAQTTISPEAIAINESFISQVCLGMGS